MNKKIFGIFLLIVFMQTMLYAHSGKPKYHVIIDTDGAVDDMRAICMLLAGNDIRVLAITCSQGTLDVASTYKKVNSLLQTFRHEGISTGIGDKTDYPLPQWNAFAEGINWGNQLSDYSQNEENTTELLNRITKDYPYKITLIALGSLKTYSDWIKKNPEKIRNIEKIIWYNNEDIKKGFNYLVDTTSYDFIKNSGISLDVVFNKDNNINCGYDYLVHVKQTNSIYAQQIYTVHNQAMIKEKIKQNHLKLWDDLVPLYLTVPILFDIEKRDDITFVSINKSIPEDFIYENISDLLLSGTFTNNRVFKSFPTDTSLYKPEYAEMLNTVVKKYGASEWKVITLTNEIHGHTGIYSIIGAKMGIRACEYFNVGVNNLKVTSFTGNLPPLSCFNDGIQISTGATIGQGLISVSDSVIQIPTVIFEFNNQLIRINLKNKVAEQIHEDIKKGVSDFGFSDKYWLYIENLAIKYWTNYDRHEIFNIEKMFDL